MSRHYFMALGALVFALSVAGVAPAATNYIVTDLGISCPTQSTVYGSYPLSVNDTGQVVGYISVTTATNASDRRAAYYSGGSWTDIGDGLDPGGGITPGAGRPSMATGINDSGQVGGWYAPSGIVNGTPYVYQIGSGATTYLCNVPGVLNDAYNGIHAVTGGVFGDSLWKKWTAGGGINASGEMVGYYFDSSGNVDKFLDNGTSTSTWTNGVYPNAGANYGNSANAISDSGVIVTHEDLWIDQHMPPPLEGEGWYYDASGVIHSLSVNTPTAVAGNYVVGSSTPSPFTGGVAQISTLNGVATTLALGSDTWSIATGVTSTGIAVGVSAPAVISVVQPTIDSTQRAFVYSGTATTDLNSLLVGSDPFSNLQAATAISENGDYIVGYGPVGGVMHGFLLTAILPGDANRDGKVDINDLTVVLANYNQGGMTWTEGEFTGSGTVDINDLTIVLANYNQVGAPAGGISAVPEPGALAALAGGLLGLLAYAWRRSR